MFSSTLAAFCVQEYNFSRSLHVEFHIAPCCALHRAENQAIHRKKTFFVFLYKFFFVFFFLILYFFVFCFFVIFSNFFANNKLFLFLFLQIDIISHSLRSFRNYILTKMIHPQVHLRIPCYDFSFLYIKGFEIVQSRIIFQQPKFSHFLTPACNR